MARSNKVYAMKDYTSAIIAETTAMTANVTAMRKIPVSGDVTVSENIARRQDVQAGDGRTPKAVDLKAISKGQSKTISIPFYLDDTLAMYLIENGGGKVRETATGEVIFLFNHLPAELGLGDTLTDWTGTLTYGAINPKSGESEIWAGCVVNSLSITATKGTDGGLFSCSLELITQTEVLESQATPTGLVAYTLSTKTIGDFCNTSTIDSDEVSINSFTTTYTFNPKLIGVCTDGDATVIAKNASGLFVDHTIVYAVDDNTADHQQLGRSATTFPIEMSDGSDFFFKSASCNPTADVTKTGVEDMAFWTLNARAFALTSGNMHEVKI